MSRIPFPVRALPRYAEAAWFTPPPVSSRALGRWEGHLDGTASFEVDYDGETLRGFRVGEGPPVLLIHGWGGRAAQMAPIGIALASLGFSAYAVDAPGHDGSGRRTNVFEMAGAIRKLASVTGEPSALVAHSLGAMATLHAFEGDLPDRVVLVSPVLDVDEVVDTFSRRAGLFPWTERSLRRRIKAFVGPHWEEFAAGSRVDLGGAKTLIVHDPDDEDTRFSTSAAIAAMGETVEISVVEDLGHHRVLHDEKVASDISRFIAGIASAGSSAGVEVSR